MMFLAVIITTKISTYIPGGFLTCSNIAEWFFTEFADYKVIFFAVIKTTKISKYILGGFLTCSNITEFTDYRMIFLAVIITTNLSKHILGGFLTCLNTTEQFLYRIYRLQNDVSCWYNNKNIQIYSGWFLDMFKYYGIIFSILIGYTYN